MVVTLTYLKQIKIFIRPAIQDADDIIHSAEAKANDRR